MNCSVSDNSKCGGAWSDCDNYLLKYQCIDYCDIKSTNFCTDETAVSGGNDKKKDKDKNKKKDKGEKKDKSEKKKGKNKVKKGKK